MTISLQIPLRVARQQPHQQQPQSLMEATTAQGAAVLLLDLPETAFAGIDLLSFTTTPRFKGVKSLPPGLHFVFNSTNSSLSIRHGAWLRVQAKPDNQLQLFVKKWDTKKEELVQETDEAELLRWRANVGSIWREGLAPYRQSAETKHEENNDWSLLTAHISDKLLSRITGSAVDHWALTSASSASRDLDNIPGLSSESNEEQRDKELDFLPVDLKMTWRPGATGRERTEAALDHSWALGDLVDHQCGGDTSMVLGEMQFCFLMILTLNNYSCMEQWKRLLRLLFTCKVAVDAMPDLFIKAIRLLKLQLQHTNDVEGGLFDMREDGAGLLKALLRKFKKNISDLEGGTAKSDVVDEFEELESFLREQYNWELDDNMLRRGMVTLEDGEVIELRNTAFDEEDESGEYAPAIVDLSPDEMRQLGQPSVGHSKPTDYEDTASMGMDDSEDEASLGEMDPRY